MRYSHQSNLGWFKRMVCAVASIPVVFLLLNTEILLREPLRSALITLLFLESVVCLSTRFGWTVHSIIFGFYVSFVPFLNPFINPFIPKIRMSDQVPDFVFYLSFGAYMGLLFGGAADLDLQWRYHESQEAKKAETHEPDMSA
jgi:hypothetical protein